LIVLWRRLVAQHDDDLTLRVDAGVVVIAVVFGGDAIAGKHSFALDQAR
jgi:hypothetical protein